LIVLQLQLKHIDLPGKSALFQWDLIYFPINFNNSHWALGKIDTINKTFILMDTMQSAKAFESFTLVAKVCPSTFLEAKV